MSGQDSITRCANAKVNLALAVAPPRESDGLHPICSWFVSIDLCDKVTIERLAAGSERRVRIEWAEDALRPSPIDWPVGKDLAARALDLLEREAGRALPAALHVRKRIPVGAGLGGGSSDAAAALIAGRELFGLEIDDDRLRALGAELGADVPFFLPPQPGGAALVEGIGEKIERSAPARATLALVAPPYGCNTGAVYRGFDEAIPDRFRERDVRDMARSGRVESGRLFNDLAAPAERAAPKLAELRRALRELTGASFHITGSGSGVFAVIEEADDEAQAAHMIEAIGKAAPDHGVVVTRVVGEG